MIDYIQKGGLLMWPILACSVIAIAVFAERLLYLHRATIHVGEFLQGLSNLLQRRNFAEALHESAGTPGPVARVIHAAIIRHDAPRNELREIVQEDELHVEDLTSAGVLSDTFVRINEQGDIEVRRTDRWDVIGGLLGNYEQRIKLETGLDWAE